MTQPIEPIESIVHLQRQVYNGLRSSLSGPWMTTECTMPQIRVLLILNADGPLRMTECATAIDTSLSAATGIIDRLVQSGLVSRRPVPEDRRVVVAELTDLVGQRWSGFRRRAWSFYVMSWLLWDRKSWRRYVGALN